MHTPIIIIQQLHLYNLNNNKMNRLEILSQAINQEQNIYDYIVVGAGVSGLQAAEILTLSNKYKVLILEAQPHVGGRITTINIGDLDQAKKKSWTWQQINKINQTFIQKGATWIQERHVVCRELCKQMGITLRQQFSKGECLYLAGNTSYSSKQLMKHQKYGPKIVEIVNLIDKISQEYNKLIYSDLKLPSKQSKDLLKKYDSLTVADFFKQHITPEYDHIRDVFQNFFEHSQCMKNSQNSMHQVLTKNARSNDLGIIKQFLGAFGDHEASYLINGGSEILIQKLIQKIQKNLKKSFKNIIRLSHYVTTIDNRIKDKTMIICQLPNHVTRKYYCKQVICAVPLGVSKIIAFTNISRAKSIIIDNQLRTNSHKCFMIVKKPFWRQHATGDGLFSKQHLINMCHDISPEDESCGIMVFFNHGDKLDSFETTIKKGQRKQYIQSLMCKLFKVKPEDEKKLFEGCIFYQSTYNNDQFVRSGFQSSTRPGTFNQILSIGDSINALYRDQNGITFVGSQYSLQFASYIEGALRITRQKVYKLINEKDPLSYLLVDNLKMNP